MDQVISASQADDLITFTADWKKSMNAVVTALKEVDDQTAEMLRGIIRSLFEIAKVKVREELVPVKRPRHRFKNKKKEDHGIQKKEAAFLQKDLHQGKTS